MNLHGDARVTNKKVFTKTGLTNAQHTLRLVKVSGDVLRNDMLRYTLAK